jgi:hypothetical protein
LPALPIVTKSMVKPFGPVLNVSAWADLVQNKAMAGNSAKTGALCNFLTVVASLTELDQAMLGE